MAKTTLFIDPELPENSLPVTGSCHLCSNARMQTVPQALEFSLDGRLLAITGDFNGHPPRVKIWQVSDGALLCKIETGLGSRHLTFSPDNLLLAVGDGSRLGLWELPKETPKWMRTTPDRISQLSFSNDGQMVNAIGADGNIRHFPQ